MDIFVLFIFFIILRNTVAKLVRANLTSDLESGTITLDMAYANLLGFELLELALS